MANYQLSTKAVQDLKEIWNYTYDNWSEMQADRYYGEIIEHIKQIAERPASGRSYRFIWENLRGSKVNRHIIFYRKLNEEKIESERILHERMDFISRISN